MATIATGQKHRHVVPRVVVESKSGYGGVITLQENTVATVVGEDQTMKTVHARSNRALVSYHTKILLSRGRGGGAIL